MRNLKKVLALVLAMAMSLSLAVTAGAATLGDYSDSDKVTAKYATAVDFASQLGILEGFTDGKYHPQGTLTRAQLATMVYRMTTADVDDVYTANFAGGAAEAFSDTAADAWYAGYVGYAADAELLKGLGDGTYAPDSALTGYAALAAFLRGVGYDEPGYNFVGADWTVEVAKVAKQVGALEGITNVDLNKPITREVAAQMIYNIMFTKNVVWTDAFGYQTSNLMNKDYGTLALNEFDMFNDKDGEQVKTAPWGRVATEWYEDVNGTANTNEVLVSVDADPVAVYNTKVAECDIAKDLGLKADADINAEIRNGDAETTFGAEIDLLDTTSKGAQGRLIEVYEWGTDDYVIVVLDQFLAEVTKTTDVKYDKNGHVDVKASMTLKVHVDGYCNSYCTSVTVTAEENFEYAVGDMLLIYFDDSRDDVQPMSALAGTNSTTVEVVDYADSIVGKQTAFTNKESHIINGTEYMDAVQFNHDEAQNQTTNHTWYFDTYGNLIGAFDIESVYNYGTITDIRWVDSHAGADAFAEATITYVDGSTDVKAVETITFTNGKVVTLAGVEGTGSSYTSGLVSSSVQYNDEQFANIALYQISENDDGSVDLVSVTKLPSATIKTGVTKLAEGVYADENTMFLVWNGTDYDTYTGIKNVPEYTGTYMTWYYNDYDAVNGKGDKGVEYVFVINPTDKTETGTALFYYTEGAVKTGFLKDGVVDYYTIAGGFIDGTEGTLYVDVTAIGSLTEGKLYEVSLEDGYVVSATAITTAESLNDDNTLFALEVGTLTEAMLSGYLMTVGSDVFTVDSVRFVNATYEDMADAIGEYIWIVYSADHDMDVVDVYVK